MKILVLDDHPVVRTGIKAGLEAELPHLEIAEATNLAEANELVDEGDIEIAILDLRLKEESGLHLAVRIADNGLATRCIVLTSVLTPRILIDAFNTGTVVACLEKDSDLNPLIEAISAAAKGMSSLTPLDVRSAEKELRNQGKLVVGDLTPRELEISFLIADGLTDTEISDDLHLATSTVRNTLSNIYKKLGLDGRTQLAAAIWELRTDLDLLIAQP